MYWLVLVISGLLEAAWALALDRSQGFTKLGPSIFFLVTLALSMGGLAYAMRGISVGTAYAIWVGIGAATTVAAAMLMGTESFHPIKVLLMVGLVGCVIGLKVFSPS